MAWQTHDIDNLVDELVGINLFETDRALRDAVDHAGAGQTQLEQRRVSR
jgi:putative acyl-CoA dehydrogenase